MQPKLAIQHGDRKYLPGRFQSSDCRTRKYDLILPQNRRPIVLQRGWLEAAQTFYGLRGRDSKNCNFSCHVESQDKKESDEKRLPVLRHHFEHRANNARNKTAIV